jgi:hypothetical protein
MTCPTSMYWFMGWINDDDDDDDDETPALLGLLERANVNHSPSFQTVVF